MDNNGQQPTMPGGAPAGTPPQQPGQPTAPQAPTMPTPPPAPAGGMGEPAAPQGPVGGGMPGGAPTSGNGQMPPMGGQQ